MVDYLLQKQRKILNYCPGLVDHYILSWKFTYPCQLLKHIYLVN